MWLSSCAGDWPKTDDDVDAVDADDAVYAVAAVAAADVADVGGRRWDLS